jgi:uncharacterized coiled-coil protein SlyX
MNRTDLEEPMTTPGTEADLRAVIARQQDTIEKLIATVELHQRQLDALWRRVQDLEGVPFPDQEPPES